MWNKINNQSKNEIGVNYQTNLLMYTHHKLKKLRDLYSWVHVVMELL